MNYRRRFGAIELEEWNELMDKLERAILTNQNDRVTWKLESLGKFITMSLYRLITFGGVKAVKMMEVRSAKDSTEGKDFHLNGLTQQNSDCRAVKD
jgi:phosphodiesterase/alkaline phosphatase D-like protein